MRCVMVYLDKMDATLECLFPLIWNSKVNFLAMDAFKNKREVKEEGLDVWVLCHHLDNLEKEELDYL